MTGVPAVVVASSSRTTGAAFCARIDSEAGELFVVDPTLATPTAPGVGAFAAFHEDGVALVPRDR